MAASNCSGSCYLGKSFDSKLILLDAIKKISSRWFTILRMCLVSFDISIMFVLFSLNENAVHDV